MRSCLARGKNKSCENVREVPERATHGPRGFAARLRTKPQASQKCAMGTCSYHLYSK